MPTSGLAGWREILDDAAADNANKAKSANALLETLNAKLIFAEKGRQKIFNPCLSKPAFIGIHPSP